MNFPKTKLTQLGLDAVLDAVYGGSQLTFTCAKLGSGNAPNEDWEQVTDVATVVTTLGIGSLTVADHMATMRFRLENSTLQAGFYMREIGIYARIDDGPDFLYAYTNAGADAGYVKPYDADNFVTIEFDVVVDVGNEEYVNAVISGSVGYVTVQEFNSFYDNDYHVHVVNYTNPHKVTKAQVGLGLVVNAVPSDHVINFTVPASLTRITSGKKLSYYMGMLARAIITLLDHLVDTGNPHKTTWENSGAAPRQHTHGVEDLSGVLPIPKGGTGVATLPELKALVGKARSYATGNLEPSGWDGKNYDLETLYNSAAWDVEVELAKTATAVQRKAFSRAMIVGDSTGNVLHAFGRVPDVTIPVVYKLMER
jgi:hypothetical protein